MEQTHSKQIFPSFFYWNFFFPSDWFVCLSFICHFYDWFPWRRRRYIVICRWSYW